MPFYGIKTRSSKSGKIDIFQKGLTDGFGPKMAMFSTFFFRQCSPGKCLLRYSRAKKPPSRLYKQEVQKVEKLTFFKGVNPWVLSKKGHFYNSFFLGNIDQENVFYDLLERTNAFLGYKNKKFKRSKN